MGITSIVLKPFTFFLNPFNLILAPVKLIYLFSGFIVISGVLLSVWGGHIDMFIKMMFLSIVWSVVYSFLYS